MGAVDTPLTVLQAKAQAVMSGDLIRSVSVLVNRNLIYRILMYHNLLDRLLVMAALVEAGVTQIRVIQMGVETNNPQTAWLQTKTGTGGIGDWWCHRRRITCWCRSRHPGDIQVQSWLV